MATARDHDDATLAGHRGSWPAIASTVALVLAAGVALQVVVDLITNLGADEAEARTTGIKFLRLAGDVADSIAILLIAAVLVLIARALAGADRNRALAAMVIAVTSVVVALVLLIALLMSFDDIGGQSVAGAHPWQFRIHLVLGIVAALAAAALANEARDRTGHVTH